MQVICPRCKGSFQGLVKRYDVINQKTGIGESVEFEKSCCEDCAREVFEWVQDQVKNRKVVL